MERALLTEKRSSPPPPVATKMVSSSGSFLQEHVIDSTTRPATFLMDTSFKRDPALTFAADKVMEEGAVDHHVFLLLVVIYQSVSLRCKLLEVICTSRHQKYQKTNSLRGFSTHRRGVSLSRISIILYHENYMNAACGDKMFVILTLGK